MLKIKDLNVGDSVVLIAIVKEAIQKKTKPPGNKPYLYLTVFDGADTISGNHWDYGDKNPPPKNAILNVHAVVGEWQGNKQLNIKTITKNEEYGPEAFVPSGDVDIDYYMERFETLIGEIHHPHLQQITHAAFIDFKKEWRTLPAAKSVHHAYVGALLKHSVDVAVKAAALADLIPYAEMDLVLAGGLLHDFGKIWVYKFDGASIEFTEEGNMIEHLVAGVKYTEKYRNEANSKALDLIQHIIVSHHGKMEYGSPMTPKFLEAWIVNAADMIDAKSETILDANRKAAPGDIYTDKVWSLENRQMFTQEYVRGLLGYDEFGTYSGQDSESH
ncbi:3'-5' exoribonuclease YhaM [compost metagenome]